MLLVVSSNTPSKFGGPPLGLKSTKMVPGKSSLAMIVKGFDPSKLSDPTSVTIFPLFVIFLYKKKEMNGHIRLVKSLEKFSCN